jgi:hypothetical protein
MYPNDARGVVIEREPISRSVDDTHRAPDLYPEDNFGALTHWRTTLAGTLVAMTVLLFLGLLGLAVGLTSFNAATAASQGGLPKGLGTAVGLWTAVSLFIAFFAGGHIAAKLTHVRDPEQGAWRAVPVFLLASPLLVWLLLAGLVGAASMVAATIGGLHLDPSVQARANPTGLGDIAGHLRDATWGALFGCVLGLAGSALGGLVAGQRRRPMRERSDRVRHTRV